MYFQNQCLKENNDMTLQQGCQKWSSNIICSKVPNHGSTVT